jgi:hypothetical protein
MSLCFSPGENSGAEPIWKEFVECTRPERRGPQSGRRRRGRSSLLVRPLPQRPYCRERLRAELLAFRLPCRSQHERRRREHLCFHLPHELVLARGCRFRLPFAFGCQPAEYLIERVEIDNLFKYGHRQDSARTDRKFSAILSPSNQPVETCSLGATSTHKLFAQMQALMDGVEREVQAVRDTQLVKDIVQMILDRLLADKHLLGYIFIFISARH